jgi:hypothetical protein
LDEKETPDIGVKNLTFEGFCDSDWGNDPDSRKSVTGYVIRLAGGAVSWASRRQTIVAQSTAEAEYVAACEAAMEGSGLRNILQELVPECEVKLTMGIDNSAAFVMVTNPTYSRRTRHIELRWHYVRDQFLKGLLMLRKVASVDNLADLFTKPLPRRPLEELCQAMGVTSAHSPKD